MKKELYTGKKCFTLRAWKRCKQTAAPARTPNMQKICIFLALHRQILNRRKDAENVKDKHMTYSGSIYFLGQFRPAYFSATNLKDLRAKMRVAIQDMPRDEWEWFAWRIDNVTKELRKPNCAGASAEQGARGISVAKRPHDPWLANVVARLPAHDTLLYPA